HNPEIYERSPRLGGNLIPGGAPKFKEDDHALADWYTYELNRLNVPIHLNKEVTKEFILQSDADVVIMATGSNPKIF
ncbi:2-enoate reductase, partial [Alkalihalophilus lindianensis]|nr:2-enoate reductase [Alkalihalophilus lindianensis]